MKRIVICFVLVFIFISAPLFAKTEANGDQKIKCLHLKTPVLPKIGHCIDDFVPKGWKLIDKVVGDLNKDGLPDMAGVIEEIVSDADKEECSWCAHRILFIAFNKGSGRYKLSIQNNDIILSHGDGGTWGDPFIPIPDQDKYQQGNNQKTGIFINRGTLVIKFYGGTGYRWSHKYTFRYQNKDWYLIGYDHEWYWIDDRKQYSKLSENYITRKRIDYDLYPYDKITHLPVKKEESINAENSDNYDWKLRELSAHVYKHKYKLDKLRNYNPWER
jgi:hypothetical protein